MSDEAQREEARRILQTLGEPVSARVTNYELFSVRGKDNVTWYTLETTWSNQAWPTRKKQRFKVIHAALGNVEWYCRERLKLQVKLPKTPTNWTYGRINSTRDARAKEISDFLSAAVSHEQLRRYYLLVLLLAPDTYASASRSSSTVALTAANSLATAHVVAASTSARTSQSGQSSNVVDWSALEAETSERAPGHVRRAAALIEAEPLPAERRQNGEGPSLERLSEVSSSDSAAPVAPRQRGHTLATSASAFASHAGGAPSFAGQTQAMVTVMPGDRADRILSAIAHCRQHTKYAEAALSQKERVFAQRAETLARLREELLQRRGGDTSESAMASEQDTHMDSPEPSHTDAKEGLATTPSGAATDTDQGAQVTKAPDSKVAEMMSALNECRMAVRWLQATLREKEAAIRRQEEDILNVQREIQQATGA